MSTKTSYQEKKKQKEIASAFWISSTITNNFFNIDQNVDMGSLIYDVHKEGGGWS